MPCRSDYMEPNEQEAESRKVAQLILYVLNSLENSKDSSYRNLYLMEIVKYPTMRKELKKVAENFYGDSEQLDKLTRRLCELCRLVPDSLLYDGKVKESRELADWYQNHEKVDAEREALEAKVAKDNADREKILKNLSEREKHLLGIDE